MAHKVVGIDLGTWSVKLAVLEAGFRQTRLVAVHERPLLPLLDGETEAAQAGRTLAALVAEERLQPEMWASALVEEVTLRPVSLPAVDKRRAEQSLGFELEGQVMSPLEELVFDFVVARPAGNGREDVRVLAVVAKRAEVQAHLATLAACKVEPRLVGAAALSYAALVPHLSAPGEASGAQVLVDVGHRRTQVSVVDGANVVFARTIHRGGEEFTRAIVDAFRMSWLDAEQSKHEQAFMLTPGETAETPSHRRIDALMREAARPLIRELKQTLAAARAEGVVPAGCRLTGGGARLRGLGAHLEAELSLPVTALALRADDPLLLMSEVPLADVPAQALGIALALGTVAPQVNLRKGELAFKNDYSYLRGKALYLAIGGALVLLFAAGNAIAAWRALDHESTALEAQLRAATTELFHEPRLDAKAISDELRKGPRGGAPPIPSTTAFDLLNEITHHVPAADKIHLDINELDIRAKKTTLRGTAESVQAVDALVAELEKIDCFSEVEKDKILSVNVAPSGDNAKGEKATEMKQFTLNITTTCP